MTDKTDLIAQLDALAALLQQRSTNPLALLLPKGWLLAPADKLYDGILEAEQAIQLAEEKPTSVFEWRKQVFDLDKAVHRLLAASFWLPVLTAIVFAVLLLVAADLVLYYFGLLKSVMAMFDIPLLVQLAFLGLAGALIHLMTTAPSNQNPTVAILDLSLPRRVFLAIIVPIVLVILFYNSATGKLDLSHQPQLVSFACGYSAKLAVDFSNKVVEKVSAVIASI